MQKKIGKGGVLGGSDYKNRSMKEVLAGVSEAALGGVQVLTTGG